MRRILAVDTSGPSAGVAVYADGEIRAEIFLNSGLVHSKTIMPCAEEAVEKAGLRIGDIDLFACVTGPGSFTGVRIGTCAVRGMANALNKPCVAIDALDAIAYGVYGFDGTVCPMLDARRDQVYAAAFRDNAKIIADEALALNEFFDKLPETGKLLFLGEAAPLQKAAIAERFGDRAVVAPAHFLHVRPASAAVLASMMPEESYVPAMELLPLYLRAPSAERERERKERAKA